MPNELPPGVTSEMVASAVKRSGFPFQLRVAARLRALLEAIAPADVRIEHEWSFVDRDTSELRTLDLLALVPLTPVDIDNAGVVRVRPQLALLVECKQSEMPYVFFKGDSVDIQSEIIETDFTSRAAPFPMIAGLRREIVEVMHRGKPTGIEAAPVQALDLEEHPFLAAAPRYSPIFSRLQRKESKLEVGGDDAFRGVILPLVKALDHFKKEATPIPTFRYFDLRVAFAVCVIEGPMVLVDADASPGSLERASWVRVVRQEARPDRHPRSRTDVYVIDCVHSEFLDTYVSVHMAPFAEEFAKRALRHHRELATGLGRLVGIPENDERLEPWLKPLTEKQFEALPAGFRNEIPWVSARPKSKARVTHRPRR
ncbi:MAG TPA: hypothetical protein VFM06_03970 [Candidatus Limnocylindria bacterium]|nr:hypothetical protein [Candidatus Limnocylindria bacterium]